MSRLIPLLVILSVAWLIYDILWLSRENFLYNLVEKVDDAGEAIVEKEISKEGAFSLIAVLFLTLVGYLTISI